jgi:hypothetical protein
MTKIELVDWKNEIVEKVKSKVDKKIQSETIADKQDQI